MAGSGLPARGRSRILQLDRNALNIGRQYVPDLAVVGDAGAVLPLLLKTLPESKKAYWRDEIARSKGQWESKVRPLADSGAVPLEPAHVVRAIERELPKDAILVVDTGDHTYWWGELYRGPQPAALLSWWWRTVGFRVPAAIGARVVRPDKPVVAIVGDAGFAMMMAEFNTAVHHRLPIKVIVLDNRGMARERHDQLVKHGVSFAVDYTPIDFAQVARACGGSGYRVDDPANLVPAVKRVLGDPLPTTWCSR